MSKPKKEETIEPVIEFPAQVGIDRGESDRARLEAFEADHPKMSEKEANAFPKGRW